MLSALSAAKKRTQPPLLPTNLRSIHVIRDLLIGTCRILSIVWTRRIFYNFSAERPFSIHEDVAPLGVMIRLRAADESSLSDDAVKLIVKTAIRQAHLHESIFRPFRENSLIREFVIKESVT